MRTKMKRVFPYITVGKILDELEDAGLPLNRVTFYRLEKRLNLPMGKLTTAKLPWRIYNRAEADSIKDKILKEYRII